MPNQTKQKIRDICTFHGEDGTSGYLLSEGQFEELFELFDGRIDSIIGELEGKRHNTLQWKKDVIDAGILTKEQINCGEQMRYASNQSFSTAIKIVKKYE